MISTDELTAISIRAGEAILGYYEDEIDVEKKGDNSPLTRADIAAHHVIVDSLKAATPDIPVISEESGIPPYENRKEWEKFWLVDPLDGTKEFIKKNGEFTVNIALIERGVPVLGVVHIPARRTIYTGQRGYGAFKTGPEGERTRIFSTEPDTSRPLNIVTSRSHKSGGLEEKMHELGVTIGSQIPAGSSLKFCLVAEGTADLYPRLGPTMEWDTAAGDAVFRYSGRHETRYSPLSYNKPDMKNPGFVIGIRG